jgi:putative flavoprotein involved in K+ transport
VHSVDYRNPQPYRDQDVLVVGAGNSGTEIAVDLAQGGARRVRIAVHTPPNILRRDVKGFPIQLLGIVFRRLPPRLLDPLILGLERVTIPDRAKIVPVVVRILQWSLSRSIRVASTPNRGSRRWCTAYRSRY